jgi:hypothetical protein
MQVKYYQPNFCILPVGQRLDWSYQPNNLEFKANTWVQLHKLPNDYSHDEALLLCELTADEWVAWVPGHGETVLNVRDFCA